MRISLCSCMVMLALVLGVFAGRAKAQAEQPKPADPAVATESKASPVGVTPVAPPPPRIEEAEEVTFERVTGFFFEGRGGVFMTFGGYRGYSNPQPVFGFEVGYDISPSFSLGFSTLFGYQAANALKEPTTSGIQPGYHLDFGLTFFNLAADLDIWTGKRWALEARLGGGAVLINPTAKQDQSNPNFDFFGGFRFEYYTLLKHFTMGLELDGYYIAPVGIPAFSGSFSVLYTF